MFRLNFRDHGETHHLNREMFHSCRIDEVVGAVREIAAAFSPRALAIGGFSLGGNFALRVALRAPAAGIALAYALAVCPVISPASGLYVARERAVVLRALFPAQVDAARCAQAGALSRRGAFSREELEAATCAT